MEAMPKIPDETDARKLLQHAGVQRDITDPRSCREIALALGLLSQQPAASTAERLQQPSSQDGPSTL